MDKNSFWGPALSGMLMSAVLLLALASTAGAGSAPDFTLKDVISGKEYTLSQLRGQVVMLNFFTFTCEPCKAEMPYLQQIDQEFKGQGFQMIGIGLASTLGTIAFPGATIGGQLPDPAGERCGQQGLWPDRVRAHQLHY